jgi:hypothetical protein
MAGPEFLLDTFELFLARIRRLCGPLDQISDTTYYLISYLSIGFCMKRGQCGLQEAESTGRKRSGYGGRLNNEIEGRNPDVGKCVPEKRGHQFRR